MAEKIKTAEFAAKTGKGAAVVDFFADWCGPCKMFGPVFEEAEKEYAGKAGFYKVNIDEESDLAKANGIMTIPTVFFMKDGVVKDRISGVLGKEDLTAKLDNLL
jgi:thioredoxin 1